MIWHFRNTPSTSTVKSLLRNPELWGFFSFSFSFSFFSFFPPTMVLLYVDITQLEIVLVTFANVGTCRVCILILAGVGMHLVSYM